VNQVVSGWQFNIINSLRSGFPFTPALGFNWSRDGNTSTPDRVSFAARQHGREDRHPARRVEKIRRRAGPRSRHGGSGIGWADFALSSDPFTDYRLRSGCRAQPAGSADRCIGTRTGRAKPMPLVSTSVRQSADAGIAQARLAHAANPFCLCMVRNVVEHTWQGLHKPKRCYVPDRNARGFKKRREVRQRHVVAAQHWNNRTFCKRRNLQLHEEWQTSGTSRISRLCRL